MTDATFARSAATDTLISMLINCQEGAVITYEAMSRATNRDIQKRDRYLLISAMKAARNDANAVFSTVTKVGVQRMKPEEVMLSGRRRIKRIASAARRGGKEMDTVPMERLTPDQRLAHAAIRGVFAVIQASSKPAPPPSTSAANTDPVVKLM